MVKMAEVSSVCRPPMAITIGPPISLPSAVEGVSRNRQGGPHAGLIGRRDAQREPCHGDHTHAVANRGEQICGHDPAPHRSARYPAEGPDLRPEDPVLHRLYSA